MNPLDPFFPQKLLAAVVLLGLYGLGSFVGGCEWKTRKVEAAKIEGIKNAARLAKQDGIAGNNAAAELRKTEEGFARTAISLSRAANSASLVSFTCPSRNSSQEVPQTADPKTQNSSQEVVNETLPIVRLSADFMWMYDLSYSAKGDAGVRPPSYGSSEGPTINEGFSAIVVPNNSECSSDREVLRKIQEEVRRKQKLYAPLFKD